ncbi:hypothetical protein BT63DRAFT_443666 [Microthyrium microscopicum]|uniref:Uncharacterized protein n=1 Tax=Microthyrium microscopicum TaxID=703497 RepID=A0A6A6TYV3_9PEZI|nr:hypothetical protein BT63DRAFT_443666 [Microthyrium microscopicum]
MIRGKTITLNTRSASFLVAFIALFTATAGSCLWTICCFLLHRHFSHQNSRDALQQQRQIILRNSNNASSGIMNLVSVFWAWWREHKSATVIVTLLPIVVFGIIFQIALTSTGILSSLISSADGQVLLKGDGCGFGSTLHLINASTQQLIIQSGSKASQDPTTRVASCYRNSSFNQDCPTYIRRSLPYQVTSDDCPYPGGDNICYGDSKPITFDSGVIDGNLDMGLNAPSFRRFSRRVVMTCSPVSTQNYTTTVSINQTGRIREYLNYNYGSTLGNYYTGLGPQGANYTYQYPTDPPIHNSSFYRRFEYSLFSLSSYQNTSATGANKNGAWRPIDALDPSLGDNSISFLSLNDIGFSKPVNDTWFSAKTPLQVIPGGGMNYFRDDPIRAMGCVTKHQICNIVSAKCTPLAGIYPTLSSYLKLWDTEDRVYMNRSVLNSFGTQPSLSPPGIGSQPSQLLANGWLGLIYPLPTNQWQTEVEYWFQLYLATIQGNGVQTATIKSAVPALSFMYWSPNGTEEMSACGSQKITSESFRNFDLVGLILTFVLGGVLILVSFVVPAVVGRASKNGEFAALEWNLNDPLNLHRIAHGTIGSGQWTTAGGSCPVTEHELGAMLDITDMNHPRLRMFDAKIQESEGFPADSKPVWHQSGSKYAEVSTTVI